MINKESKDYKDGYQSGLLYNREDPLCEQNLIKCKMKHESESVANYWAGYMAGARVVVSIFN